MTAKHSGRESAGPREKPAIPGDPARAGIHEQADLEGLHPAGWAAPFHFDPGPDSPRVVRALVEVPKGSRNKYELDKRSGLVRLDRHLYSASHYPGDYGFVPGTLAGDGDPLDVLVMLNDPTFSSCLIEARVVGLFRMTDGGKEDLKVLGVPHSDPLFSEIQELEDVPRHFLREVEHFFSTYKTLEGVSVSVDGWDAAEVARTAIVRAVEEFRKRVADEGRPEG